MICNPFPVPRQRPAAYGFRYPAEVINNTGATGAKPGDNVMAIPWYSGEQNFLSYLVFDVTVNIVGCVYRAGVYSVKNWRSAMRPNVLLGATSNTTPGTTNPGIMNMPLLTTLRIRRRMWYFFAVYHSLAATFRCNSPTGAQGRMNCVLPATGINGGLMSHIGILALGGLPNPFPVPAAGNYWSTDAPLLVGHNT